MTLHGSRNSSTFLVLVVCLLLLDFITVNGAVRRTRRRTSTRSTKRTIPKLTANTPLPVTSYSSSVIRSQALNPTYTQTFRTRFLTGAVAGALVYSYAYSANNRVFSGIYTPYATLNLLVSQRRALRIAREKYQI